MEAMTEKRRERNALAGMYATGAPGRRAPEPVIAAACAVGIFAVIYLFLGMYPFGDGSIAITDLYSQYLPLLYRFFDVVTGEKNLFLDFSVSGGANLYVDTINEVLNPFNYVLLFFGRDMLYQAVNLALLLYVAAAAASADLFLLRVFPQKREFNLVLSLCYALSPYMAYNYQIIKWMYFPVLFPLFCLALRRLLREGRGGLYGALLGYQLMLSIQLGFMTLLFTFFGSGIYFFCCVKKEERQKRMYRLGIYTLAGICLAGAVLVPNIRILLSSSRAGENLSYWAVMKRHGLDDLFERLFQIGHPVLLALFLYALRGFLKKSRGEKYVCFTGRKKTGLFFKAFVTRWKDAFTAMPKEGRFLLLLSLFLWLTVLFEPANLLWHMGSYVCFPVRYGYMVIFSGICLIKWLLLEKKEETHTAYSIRRIMGAGGGIVLCACACGLTLLWEERIVQAFSSLAISLVCPKETVMVSLILSLLFAAAFCALFADIKGAGTKAADRKEADAKGGKLWRSFQIADCGVLLTAAACGICLFLFIFLPSDNGVRQLNEEAYRSMTVQKKQDLQENGEETQGGLAGADDVRTQKEEPPFYRVKNGTELPLNAALVNGRSSLAGYFPTGNRQYYEAMEQLGYQVQWVATGAEGGTGVSDAVLSAGLLFDRDAAALLLRGDSVLERQQELAALAGCGDCMERFDAGMLKRDGDGAFCIENPDERTVYLDPAMTTDSFLVWVNGKAPALLPEDSAFAPHRIVETGAFSEEELRLLVTDKNGATLPMEEMEIALLDQKDLEQKMEEGTLWARRLTGQELSVDAAGGSIRISLTGAKAGQTIFLPVAALDGWRCSLNGKNVAITPVFHSFLGITTQEGVNGMELRFIPPGLWAGAALSLAGAAGLAICGLARRKKRTGLENPKAVALAGGLYGCIFVLALAGIYLIPAAGLLWYLAGKIFGCAMGIVCP